AAPWSAGPPAASSARRRGRWCRSGGCRRRPRARTGTIRPRSPPPRPPRGPGPPPPSRWLLRRPVRRGCPARPSAHHRQRQEPLAGGADLDLGVHLRAHAAVEARRPPAVLDLTLLERVQPVLPQPLLVQAGVDVVPRQHLVLAALPGGVPGHV